MGEGEERCKDLLDSCGTWDNDAVQPEGPTGKKVVRGGLGIGRDS